MKPIGSIVAGIAYDNKVSREAVEALDDLQRPTRVDLNFLGLTDGRISDLLALARTDFIEKAKLCESPIEQVMLACLSHMVVPGTDCFPVKIHDVNSGDEFPDHPVVIAPQFVIARYRLDFLVSVKTGNQQLLYAVECDGRDHHSSTEAVKSDAFRDRYLASLGIKTIRYSGSWIMKHKGRAVTQMTCSLLRAA